MAAPFYDVSQWPVLIILVRTPPSAGASPDVTNEEFLCSADYQGNFDTTRLRVKSNFTNLKGECNCANKIQHQNFGTKYILI